MLDDAHNNGKVWRNKPAVVIRDTSRPPKDYAEPTNAEPKSYADRLDDLPDWQRGVGVVVIGIVVTAVVVLVVVGLYRAVAWLT